MQNELQTWCVGYKRARQTEKRATREASHVGSSNPQETPGVWVGVLLLWLIFWFKFTFGAWIMGREKPEDYWFPGPVSSALRVLRAVKILSWDEVGCARLLEEWTGVPVHQSARTACLTIMGMTAAVSGSVLIGKHGPIKRGCAYVCRALAGGGHTILMD